MRFCCQGPEAPLQEAGVQRFSEIMSVRGEAVWDFHRHL